MILSQAKELMAKAVGRQPLANREEQAYLRLAGKGFVPDGIIDIGAYQGEWTRLTRRVFPAGPSLMVEAQSSKKPWLDRVCADLADTSHVCAVLGAKSGETVSFYEMETGSSFLPEQSNAERTKVDLVTRTLDDVAAQFPGKKLFLKLDVQGAELHLLAGGQDTLARSAVVQLEVALLAYNKGAPTILDVLKYMDERDFVPFDISGETRLQGHLVQIDLLFTPRASALRPDRITF